MTTVLPGRPQEDPPAYSTSSELAVIAPREPEIAEPIAQTLARPATIRSIHRPVVALADGTCLGYQATVRVGDWAARSAAPYFEAAAQAGLSGQLGALALQSAVRERVALPADKFLAVEMDADALTHRDVLDVLERAGEISDLVLSLISPYLAPRHPAIEVVSELRGRGLLVAAGAGGAGLDDLTALEHLVPDLVRVPAELVRDVHLHAVRRRLVENVVDLAEELGAAVLAEDVESLDEASVLRGCGVRLASGWLFGRARPGFAPPSPEVCEWLRVWNTRPGLIPRQFVPSPPLSPESPSEGGRYIDLDSYRVPEPVTTDEDGPRLL
ncbi:EAL domain-containing protein [Kineosporia rhizophila]|uniref:EAL domain-containing protein n=1 Tax=Kineosporia TaxID=49184 RepID=UPI001E4B0695|nr:EAL domain-containing protein [Kineosporia sp. NBRC 101677]MCE0539407.1 EAL domain-containing protein [Kineosporia rhizophila]